MMAGQVPTAAKLAELRRELGIRKHFYPKLVGRGELAPNEAAWRIEVMEAIIADYQQRDKKEQRELPLSPDEYIKRSGGDFD